MAHRVDARGLSCPQPVVMTKKALEAIGRRTKPRLSAGSEVIEVLVDNRTAMENVSRFARHSGCDVTIETGGDDDCYTVRICEKGRR
ncbi:MAG: sulfurtransferase TusA family protein [Firmicutes bacterium]|jgi:tRNA 2-thiouridine synthesizing protein A|nr:sulfurtransferase TusA family protein [Bacillota bacterium]